MSRIRRHGFSKSKRSNYGGGIMETDFWFSYKTKGGSSPENKPKVFFTCHPDDFDECFDKVCSDIFLHQNCTIFYTKDMTKKLNDADTLVDLERMNLFVIPVTSKLLSEPNRTMQFDLKFALSKHIPVLPLMMETGLVALYKKRENFGELEYMKTVGVDDTAISYEDKLQAYLKDKLVGSEMVDRIRKSFRGYIFLSYRKKDRKYANELIKMIHADPRFEDIAIWFDEYLVPGKSYRNSINTKIKESKLFALLVTPWLVTRHEDGAPNFIMSTEYPTALSYDKEVFPVEMEKTDKDILSKEFKGISKTTKTKKRNLLYKYLYDSLSKNTDLNGEMSMEHCYLMGMAYLNGVDVEVNYDKGSELIHKAAEGGCLEAIHTLSRICFHRADYDNCAYWSEKYYKGCVNTLGEKHSDTLLALEQLVVDRMNNNEYNDALIELSKKNYIFHRDVLGMKHPDTITPLCHLGVVYQKTGYYKRAIKCTMKGHRLSRKILGETHSTTGYTAYILATTYSSIGQDKKSINYYEEAYRIRKYNYGEDDRYSIEWLSDLARAYNKTKQYDKSLELYKKYYSQVVAYKGEKDWVSYEALFDLACATMCINDRSYQEEALVKLKIVYKFRCDGLGKYHEHTVDSLIQLLNCYIKLKEYKVVISLCESNYRKVQQSLGVKHKHTASILNIWALSCERSANYESALQKYEQLVDLLESKADYSRAIKALKTCRRLSNALFGKNNPHSVELLSRLYSLNKKALKKEYKRNT